MWNKISCNRLTQEREHEKNFAIHKKNLSKMKAKMSVEEPYQPLFVYTKNKLQMSRLDRQLDIQKKNDILYTKMIKIKSDNYTTNKLRQQAQGLTTLNLHTRNIMQETIFHENKRICDKLLKTNSFYPYTSIRTHGDIQQQVRYNISENANRVQSAKRLTRPTSSLTYKSSKNLRSTRISQENMRRQFKFRPDSAPTNNKFYRSSSESFLNKKRQQEETENFFQRSKTIKKPPTLDFNNQEEYNNEEQKEMKVYKPVVEEEDQFAERSVTVEN